CRNRVVCGNCACRSKAAKEILTIPTMTVKSAVVDPGERKLSAAARWRHAGSGFENAVAAKRDCSRPDSDRIDDQNAYFNANCMILGSREVLICPKVGVPKIVLGFPGRKLFVTLYASARNSAVCAPRIRNIFDNAASNSHVPGP